MYKGPKFPLRLDPPRFSGQSQPPRKPLPEPHSTLGLKTELSALALAVPTVAPEHQFWLG